MGEGLVLWGVKSIFYVEDQSKNVFKCLIKGKILDNNFDIRGRSETTPLVAGDRVIFEISETGEGKILKRLPRKNEFKRLKQGGRTIQTLVANVDTLIIVDSVISPPLRTFFIDRCLFTADIMNIETIIVFNKIDLLEGEDPDEFKFIRDEYNKLGYKTLCTSTVTGQGLDELKELLKDKVCSFNGRSGVGKSTLVKALDSNHNSIKVGDVSKKFNRGTHTTTIAKLYDLDFGAKLIDTPGVREFSIFLDRPEDVELNFRDFDKYRGKCRFTNCQHIDEPDCIIIENVNNNVIPHFRYESYLRMRDTIQKLSDSKI